MLYSGAWEKRFIKKTWNRKSCGTVPLIVFKRMMISASCDASCRSSWVPWRRPTRRRWFVRGSRSCPAPPWPRAPPCTSRTPRVRTPSGSPCAGPGSGEYSKEKKDDNSQQRCVSGSGIRYFFWPLDPGWRKKSRYRIRGSTYQILVFQFKNFLSKSGSGILSTLDPDSQRATLLTPL